MKASSIDKFSPGDRLKVIETEEDKETIFEGNILPSENPQILVLKLDNGYNVGINIENISSISLIEKRMEKKQTKNSIDDNAIGLGQKIITILHTGGTIASKVDYETGGVIARFSPEELINMFPEIQKYAKVRSRLISNMFSEDMRFAHYNKMAEEVEKELNDPQVSGIIITHGTDTLHYTSAALSFIFEGINKPLLLIGAQRSSDRGSSDAAYNLINAVYYIANSNFKDVAVCMHATSDDKKAIIIPGTKARKMHSSRRDAFKPINCEPIAYVDFTSQKIEELNYIPIKKQGLKKYLFNENLKVGLLKVHPQMFADEIKFFSDYDGLVIEGTGLGHMPINEIDTFTKEHKLIFEEIKKLSQKIPIVMSTQTINGRTQMNVYSTGRNLLESGVIGNFSDITPETSFIKLAWALSNFDNNLVKEIMKKNIRGELCETTPFEDNS